MKTNRLTKARLRPRLRKARKYPRCLGPQNYLRFHLPLRDVNDFAMVHQAAARLIVGFAQDEERAKYHLRLWGRVGGVAVKESHITEAIGIVKKARFEAGKNSAA